MGLDMYLSARMYFSKYGTNEEQKVAKELRNRFKTPNSGNIESVEVSFEIGYWRKANQIHRWFVENAQDGVDNCEEYYVSIEQLRELLSLCQEIKEDHSKAMKLLPPQEGFFFGNTDVDEDYFMDIDNTIEIVQRCIKYQKEQPTVSFYYHSSW